MKCHFEDIECIHPDDSHDVCRRCSKVPDMGEVHSVTEMRLLCSVAGKRDKQIKWYGNKHGNIPKWLEDLQKNNIFNIPCTDHMRHLGDVVINEPYDVHMEDMRQLIDFCDKQGLTFTVDGDSAHFPGRCFRICIVHKE